MVQNRNPCLSLADFSNPREGVQVISQVQKSLRNERPVCVTGQSIQPYRETSATHRDSHCTSLPPREEDPTLDF